MVCAIVRFPGSEPHSTSAAAGGLVNAVLVRNGQVLLARRATHRAAHPGLWSFPGGHVEPGETLEAALVREVEEEIGVTPRAFTRVSTMSDPKAAETDPVTFHMFAVQTWIGGEPSMLGDEHSELRWFDLPAASGLPELAPCQFKLGHYPVGG